MQLLLRSKCNPIRASIADGRCTLTSTTDRQRQRRRNRVDTHKKKPRSFSDARTVGSIFERGRVNRAQSLVGDRHRRRRRWRTTTKTATDDGDGNITGMNVERERRFR